jgi:hypothetical protein
MTLELRNVSKRVPGVFAGMTSAAPSSEINGCLVAQS